MFTVKILACLLIVTPQGETLTKVDWQAFRCAVDSEGEAGAGEVALYRLPFLGVVQHSIYVAEKIRYAVTAGVLIHPGYFLAPALDMSKIPIEELSNNTKFILWANEKDKYALDIYDYTLAPEFSEGATLASVAVVQLRDWASGRRQAPVAPICVPSGGLGFFDNLFVLKIDDGAPGNSEIGGYQIRKVIYKMNYVDKKDCEEFYHRAELLYQKMAPQNALCAAVEGPDKACVWDAGALLVSLIDFHWTLLGFGAHGPGCGAPARFTSMPRAMGWVETAITAHPLDDLGPDERAFYLRQLSPFHLTMYSADTTIPTEYGQCTGGSRGSVLFKDSAELICGSQFTMGYYLLAVQELDMVTCMLLDFETWMRSMGSMWVEHNCHREVEGLAIGMVGFDRRKMECFVYWKTTAFVEFRFVFSGKATFSMTLFGVPVPPKPYKVINLPWKQEMVTDNWYPTTRYIRPDSFEPWYVDKMYI